VDQRQGQRAGARVSRREERAAERRRRDRRGLAIAAVSTVVVIGGLAGLILTSSGWPDVRDTFFNWDVFKDIFPDVLKAFWFDVKMFVIIEAIVLVLGMAVALIRTTRGPALFPIRLLAIVYVDVFRGLPILLLVYLIGFGIPALALSGVPTDAAILGGAALALAYGAYVSEVYRAGIVSVHRGQRDAARAIGLTETQSLRHVILPQAIRRVGPPLLNDFISLQKDVVLISVLGIAGEAFRVAQIESSSSFNYTPLIAAGLCYLAITIPLARIVDRLAIGTGGLTR
jgi:polar amino acid transport system permease protein